MAYEAPTLDLSFPASTDLSANQFQAVVVTAASAVALAGAGVPILGVLQNKPKGGYSSAVRLLGVSKMKVGAGGVTAGDLVMVDASGQALTATAGNFAIGRALDTTPAGAIASVALIPAGKI